MNLLILNLKTDANDDILGFTTEWINSFSQHYEKVFVITMYKGTLAVKSNVTVFSLGKEKGYNELVRLLNFYKIILILQFREKIDVCFSHMNPLFAVMGWPILRFNKIPIFLWYAHKNVSTMLWIAEKLVTRIYSASTTSIRIPSKKITIVGHGINTDTFKMISHTNNSATFKFIHVGRISPIKNIELLINSFDLFNKKYPNATVTMDLIGGPATKKDLEYLQDMTHKVKQLALCEQINFIGKEPFTSIRERYATADCLINLSDTDSIDKVVLEAMACGVPVITSNNSFKDIFTKDLQKILMIPKKDPAALAEKMNYILSLNTTSKISLSRNLAGIVQENHSLTHLTKKISESFKLFLKTK